ncbi:ABC transporter substrate-binding protein [Georgenia alba]|uniref:ABC transporter substrate-binding protein n=1 Tax=Georgenia alba TaxID=2233858 RepID=A0ABW2QAW1_9MICO
MTPRLSSPGPSRRSVLAGGLGAGTLLALAACRPPSEQPTGSASGFQIPDPASPLPEGDVTIRLMDSGDTKVPYWQQLLAAYSEKHPNVTNEYDGLPWEQIDELVPLGVRNGTLHDVFQLAPGSALHSQAISEGWVQPLDDIMPNFDEWKAQYPEGQLVEGIHMFDGKTYCLPSTADMRYEICLMYSRQLMNDAGYDPEEAPLSWDEYRDAARRITQAGDGQVYGIVLEGAQTARLEAYINGFANQLGAFGSDPRTGEIDYTTDGWMQSFELLQALLADGSIFPGSTSLQAPQAWPRVPSGSAGMVTAGPWVITLWENDSPDFEFGVGAHPRPEADAVPLGLPLGRGNDAMFVYAETEVPEFVGDLLAYHGSPDAAEQWGRIVGPGSPPPFPDVVAALADEWTDAGNRSVELAEGLVLLPNAIIKNPNVARANQEMPPLTPSLGEIVAGVMDGSITDVRPALQDLTDRARRQREDGVAAAQQAGVEVELSDWEFPNYVPGESYTPEKYDEL